MESEVFIFKYQNRHLLFKLVLDAFLRTISAAAVTGVLKHNILFYV
jgi:hypothetical protein